MTDLLALAAQIEAAKWDGNASKPGISESRLYDGRIEFALHGKDGRLYLSVELGGYVARNDCPHYTTSIDAALTLVPEGGKDWCLSVASYEPALVTIPSGDDRVDATHATGSTPALALCAAALKARAGAA